MVWSERLRRFSYVRASHPPDTPESSKALKVPLFGMARTPAHSVSQSQSQPSRNGQEEYEECFLLFLLLVTRGVGAAAQIGRLLEEHASNILRLLDTTKTTGSQSGNERT